MADVTVKHINDSTVNVTVASTTYEVVFIKATKISHACVASVHRASMWIDKKHTAIACKCITGRTNGTLNAWEIESSIIDIIKTDPGCMQCPYLPKYYDTLVTSFGDFHSIGLVFMELLHASTIEDCIAQVKDMGELLTDSFILRTLYQLATALSTCHNAQIAHLDIKPSNVMYNAREKKITLIDFGLSTYRTPFLNPLPTLGSPMYASPEITLGRPIDTAKTDIWSFGQLCYEMVALQSQFNDAKTMADLRDMLQQKPRATDSPMVKRRDPFYTVLLDATLIYDNPKERWSADELVLHIESHIKNKPSTVSTVPSVSVAPLIK